ncbi:MAG: hypothetical protein PHQ17_03135 [Methanobacterium sp.]|nr:hypothetical protein [Methanobacterium sp.]
MDEFDPCIDIGPSEKAKDCFFNIKELELKGNLKKVESPFKILEGRSISQNSVESVGIKNPMVFEQSRVPLRYESWKRLNDLITEKVENSITGFNNFFNIKKDLYYSNFTATSLVFPRNPFKLNKFKYKNEIQEVLPLELNEYHFLLDYIHSSSTAFVLTPDIRIKEDTISIDNYLKLIDESVQILSERNSKPIFVPLQIQLKVKDFTKILSHYKKKKYTNLWINFNSRHIGGTNFAHVRRLLRNIDMEMGLTNTVLYYSHMKKEVNPNIKEIDSIGSDVISQFVGADFIGVNETPPGFFNKDAQARIDQRIAQGEFKDKIDYLRAKDLNRSRIFDPGSYYYTNLENYPNKLPFDKNTLIKNSEINKFLNSVIINGEVLRTKEYVKNNGKIKPYLQNKKCFNENEHILDTIIEKSRQSGILNYF